MPVGALARRRGQQPGQALAREQDDAEQHPAGPELPVRRVRGEHLLQQQQGGGTGEPAPDRGDAAQMTITISVPDCVQCSTFGLT
jgi:hypothetical protein